MVYDYHNMYDNREHCQVFSGNFQCISFIFRIGLLGVEKKLITGIQINVVQGFSPAQLLREVLRFGRAKALHYEYFSNMDLLKKIFIK